MKIRFYLALAAAALVMTNCSKDEEVVNGSTGTKSFTATIEGASRSSVNPETGAFAWTAGDKLSVWNGSTFDVYANSEGNENNFVAESDEAGNATGYAIYPAGEHGINNGTVTVNLPATYTYGSTNAPMWAAIEGSNLSFKHLAGVMRFVVKNVPANASKFVFTATNDIITGNYAVDSEGKIKKDGENVVNNNNSVTITFDPLTIAATEMVFYVPLPVGTYGAYTVAIQSEDNTVNLVNNESTNVSNTIGRRTLLNMPVFTVTEESGTLKLNKGKGNTIEVTSENATATTEVSGNQSLAIDVAEGTTNATIQLNYTPQPGNATLSVTDGSDEDTDPTTSVATLTIAPQNNEEVETLNINTPTLTVELGAGTYGTVNALTATETLKIGSDVTIETLVLKGGKLEITEGATPTINEIVVKDAEGFKAAWGKCSKITLAADIDLALTSGNGLTLESGEVEIDLGGYKLTTSTTAGTADDITVKGTLTVTGTGTVKTANTAFLVDGGTLNLKECTVESIGEGASALAAVNNGTLNVENVTVNTVGTAFYALSGANMTLKTCTVSKSQETTSALVSVSGQNSKLTIDGGSYTGKKIDTAYDKYVIGVKSGAKAIINTTVSGGNGGVTVIGGSTANLTGGSYTGVKACGLYIDGESIVTYSNCTFSGVEGNVVVGNLNGGGTVNETEYNAYTKLEE